MADRLITAECENCESSFEMSYTEEFVSSDEPNFCPFCGETIENLSESDEYADESDEDDDSLEEWKA